ncbi:MAG: putative bifunctional diguanylate cyclase/phosphodiesterase [Leucothrix sp.]
MDKLGLLKNSSPLPAERLRQFFLGSNITAIALILNIIFFGESLTGGENVLFFRLDLVALTIGVAVTSLLYVKLGQSQCEILKIVTVFLWLWAAVMTITTWFVGGLNSPAVISFAIILTFAALFTELIAFLALSSFLALAVVLMGFNHIYHWLPPPSEMQSHGVSRIVCVLALTSLSTYVAWLLGNILKSSFEGLKQKNQRVLQSQEIIQKLAECDDLTGLLNRTGAESYFQHMLGNRNINDDHIVAYFIDLDSFKSINDLFDHHAGDQLLIETSDRLDALLHGEDDFACRFGGDEFVLVLCTDRQLDVAVFAEKIKMSLAKPHQILGAESEITASIGVAIGCNTPSFDALCKKADMAMFKAKQSGKNQYHLYTDQLQHDYMRNLNIVNDLNSAIDNHLLDLFYQPKVNLQSNKIESAEALLRWNRGNDDGIGPEEFIPIIESTELIHSIGDWVINEACLACKKWHSEGEFIRVAVNVSALQLTRPSFYQTVADTLERVGLAPEFLEVEITEHSLIREETVVNTQLEALKTLGVSLSIDDFGTGYSNLAYLAHLQVDVLKLDRSFVSKLTVSQEYLAIVTAVIKMAKMLGMKVVAEGVETRRELEILADLDCDYGQGYLWSKAMPDSKLLSVIKNF